MFFCRFQAARVSDGLNMPMGGEDVCPICGEIDNDDEYEMYQMKILVDKQGSNGRLVVWECPQCNLKVVDRTQNGITNTQ